MPPGHVPLPTEPGGPREPLLLFPAGSCVGQLHARDTGVFTSGYRVHQTRVGLPERMGCGVSPPREAGRGREGPLRTGDVSGSGALQRVPRTPGRGEGPRRQAPAPGRLLPLSPCALRESCLRLTWRVFRKENNSFKSINAFGTCYRRPRMPQRQEIVKTEWLRCHQCSLAPRRILRPAAGPAIAAPAWGLCQHPEILRGGARDLRGPWPSGGRAQQTCPCCSVGVRLGARWGHRSEKTPAAW